MRKIKVGSKIRFRHNDRIFERLYAYLDGHHVKRVVSPDSPVGQALLGKVAGDKFTVVTPGGSAEIEVLGVN